ncbi:cytochrome P450 71B2-like [Cucurbita pepo subsp. pepo]|uniref:cytochrome P450 71B2-like n=1 Tax=Cucurbita pepo subsp. pepo TaxID=3664 RepID=UPI000C9D6586|nr:cytochrome P450 71B2-like [Cucurbita pepo subsp. pepo]
MAELVKNPQLMKKAQDPKLTKKAQEEIRNNVGNKRKVTRERHRITSMFENDSKRDTETTSPVPILIPREIISHFKIEGTDFYPKIMVQVNVSAIGRDPTYWKDLEEFLPDRFEESSIDYKEQHFEFLPFEAGRRIYPKLNLGVKTVELALANLLYYFNWRLPEGMKEEDLDMEETSGLSLSIYKKLPLKLKVILC